MRVKDKNKFKLIIDYINDQYFKNNNMPSYREIGEALQMTKSSVFDYIEEMVDEGLLTKFNNRGIATKKITKSKSLVDVVTTDNITCGSTIISNDETDEDVSIYRELIGEGDFCVLRVKGNSMINAGINDGDLVIIKQQNNAKEGQIIVTLSDQNEATLNRYFIDKTKCKVRLHPENDDMQDLYVDDISIHGIAVSVIKSLL